MEVIVIDTPLKAKIAAVGSHLVTATFKHKYGEHLAEQVDTAETVIGGCPVIQFRIGMRNENAKVTVLIQVDQSIIEVTDVPTLVHMITEEAITVINDK